MGRVTRAVEWMSLEELQLELKKTEDKRIAQRLLVVINATIEPRPAGDIARSVGVAGQTVSNWISRYNRFGPKALFVKKPRKPAPRLLTHEEEVALMRSFFSKAAKGQIATAKEIQRALEKILGFEVHHSTVYRLLERHGWRKIKGRPRHVNANPGAQERFKKNSLESKSSS